MNKKNYFSENLAYARKLKGFRQYELADKIGVRPNTISNYEKGVSEPDYDTLGKLKAVLKVSADDLVFAQPEIFRKSYVWVPTEPKAAAMCHPKTKGVKKRVEPVSFVFETPKFLPVTIENKPHLPVVVKDMKQLPAVAVVGDLSDRLKALRRKKKMSGFSAKKLKKLEVAG